MSRQRRASDSLIHAVGWIAMPLGLVLLWEVWARQADRFLFPPASAVLDELLHPLREHYASGTLLGNTVVSLLRVCLGFAVAATVGLALGLIMGVSRWVRGLLEPLVEVLRPLCPIAWIPFAIAVFGLTRVPQVFGVRWSGTILDQVHLGTLFVLFWGGLFPALINTLDGVRGIRRQYVVLARTLGANRRQLFRCVYLPATMPAVLTGLRQSLAMCWFVIIAAEMFPGPNSGIGYLLVVASDYSGMRVVLACMVIIGGVGLVMNGAMRLALRTFVRWQGRET